MLARSLTAVAHAARTPSNPSRSRHNNITECCHIHTREVSSTSMFVTLLLIKYCQVFSQKFSERRRNPERVEDLANLISIAAIKHEPLGAAHFSTTLPSCQTIYSESSRSDRGLPVLTLPDADQICS